VHTTDGQSIKGMRLVPTARKTTAPVLAVPSLAHCWRIGLLADRFQCWQFDERFIRLLAVPGVSGRENSVSSAAIVHHRNINKKCSCNDGGSRDTCLHMLLEATTVV
jgi:hypothetical protein